MNNFTCGCTVNGREQNYLIPVCALKKKICFRLFYKELKHVATTDATNIV